MPTPFMTALAELVRLLPQIRELCTRNHSIQEAIITQNEDPTGLRRIKVTREAQGGQSESDWIPCGRSTSFTDEPIPPTGTHCLIALVNGDPHKPFFLRTLSNATNPPDTGQLEPIKDNTAEIPGNDRKIVEGNRFKQVRGEQTEEIDGDNYLTVRGQKYHISAETGQILVEALETGTGIITIEAAELINLKSTQGVGVILGEAKTLIRFQQGGAYAQMQNGVWQFGNADGQTWTMGGGQWNWNLNNQNVQVTNCTGFTINGKEVIVVGSTDSDNDINNQRGY